MTSIPGSPTSIAAMSAVAQPPPRDRVGLEQYYSEAGPDYAAWSPEFNMHFGYYTRGANPFDREPMLERMNVELLGRLHLADDAPVRVADLGCGLGATMRSIARHRPLAELTGLTLVPWQVERGTALSQATPERDRIHFLHGDYEASPLPSGAYDAAYAVESSCYATGASKAAFLGEAYRMLRPGGRIAIADGFLMDERATKGMRGRILSKLCECWVIDTLGELDKIVLEMRRLGFEDIEIEQLQYRVAPSVLHIPYVTIKFLLTQVLFGKNAMTRARWNNIIAPVLLPFAGKPLGPMGYCLITATKRSP